MSEGEKSLNEQVVSRWHVIRQYLISLLVCMMASTGFNGKTMLMGSKHALSSLLELGLLGIVTPIAPLLWIEEGIGSHQLDGDGQVVLVVSVLAVTTVALAIWKFKNIALCVIAHACLAVYWFLAIVIVGASE